MHSGNLSRRCTSPCGGPLECRDETFAPVQAARKEGNRMGNSWGRMGRGTGGGHREGNRNDTGWGIDGNRVTMKQGMGTNGRKGGLYVLDIWVPAGPKDHEN